MIIEHMGTTPEIASCLLNGATPPHSCSASLWAPSSAGQTQGASGVIYLRLFQVVSEGTFSSIPQMKGKTFIGKG